MSTAPATSTAAPAAPVGEPASDRDPFVPEGTPYLLSTEDFYRMIEADIFPREARVGLWDGRIYEKMAKKYPHAVAGSKLVTALIRVLPPDWCLWPEIPIAIGPNKAPLPDMAVLRGRADDYRGRHPGADDVGLVVELADSSLRIDVGVKLAAYAAAGLPTYWVVNLKDGVIHIFETPISAEGRYASASTIRRGESVTFTLGGTRIGPIFASDLLPKE